ncbi:HAD hydrolase-like protein [Methanomassiliicoccus luminyensis]|uniref:HAD hydrolase-like protein n=1 Tax=Methanomassiliicoccus luminyensis TaxID=1080712 RepID=UPI0004746C23|nr:HAD hydrolase-like protein [Methanomassiliicoccus luminyensis]
MQKYDTYLFDFDYTLYDKIMDVYHVLRLALDGMNIYLSEDMVPEFIGKSPEYICGYYGLGGTETETYMKIFNEVVCDSYLKSVPFPDSLMVLKSLKSLGKNVSIVTGKKRWKVEELLRRDNMIQYVDHIIGFEDTEIHKPDPSPILKCMGLYETYNAKRTVYVGNEQEDVMASAYANIDCVIINRLSGIFCKELTGCTCINSLQDLL